MITPHKYLATFYGTCSVCGRPRSSPIHSADKSMDTVACSFCGVSLSAIGESVHNHFRLHHHIMLCPVREDHMWTQKEIDDFVGEMTALKVRIKNDGR